MFSGLYRWIFHREKSVEKIIIFLIVLGLILLFKENIINFFYKHINEAGSIINKILE